MSASNEPQDMRYNAIFFAQGSPQFDDTYLYGDDFDDRTASEYIYLTDDQDPIDVDVNDEEACVPEVHWYTREMSQGKPEKGAFSTILSLVKVEVKFEFLGNDVTKCEEGETG